MKLIDLDELRNREEDVKGACDIKFFEAYYNGWSVFEEKKR